MKHGAFLIHRYYIYRYYINSCSKRRNIISIAHRTQFDTIIAQYKKNNMNK